MGDIGISRPKRDGNEAVAGADQIKPMFSDAQMRKLKFAVVAMGAVLLLGFALVIGRIVYLLNRPPADAAATLPTTAARPAANLPVALPVGAVVRNISLSGQRLAIHFEAPTGDGIAIVDLAAGGQTIQRLDLDRSPATPR